MMRNLALLVALAPMVLSLAACGGSSVTPSDGDGMDAGGGGHDAQAPSPDAGGGGTDAAGADAATGSDASPHDAAPPPDDSGDGTPTRMQCTTQLGSAITQSYGRLDGYLVAIIPTTQHTCNGDNSHVHLQVKANGAVYDIAVNVDGFETERDMALPDGAWSEGWHTGITLDYVKLGLHFADFTTTGISTLQQTLENELANANHVSVFGTGYNTHDGAHLIHRNGGSADGALVIRPLAATPHIFFFRFSNTPTF
jgi:hypothetical protein